MSGAVAVFHAGALGDSVLLWPLLRAAARAGRRVWLVAAESHARLAAGWIEPGRGVPDAPHGTIEPVSGESGWVAALWRGTQGASEAAAFAARVPLLAARGEVAEVVSFVADGSSPAGRALLAGLHAVFPRAAVHAAGPPGSASRAELWTRFDVARLGGVAARANADGPIVAHAGAGGEAKRWPAQRWAALAEAWQAEGRAVRLVAGPVERERLSTSERATLDAAGLGVIDDLGALARTLAGARLFVGHDTGPTHLAAQLGVPTLALFGPTDPALWAPVGPGVRVLAPPERTADLAWLSVDGVREAAAMMLG